MIEKIKYIKNVAVFDNFNWDTEVIDEKGDIRKFSEINVIYGRNYSGKTTLARIVRSLETGVFSDKYGNHEFCIEMNDETTVTHSSLITHNKNIRVFNEDFVKENLKFINNPNEDIESFAILGDNVNIEREIQTLKDNLGSEKEGEETNLYKELKNLKVELKKTEINHSKAVTFLEDQIKTKALDKKNGIKYKSEIFGDQNYTTIKLKRDLEVVLREDFIVISEEKRKEAEIVIAEKIKSPLNVLPTLSLDFKTLTDNAEKLVTQKIYHSDKIEELVKDAVLNKWVQKGKELHQEKRVVCAFCNNKISDDRWKELDRHFDEELDNLAKAIDTSLSKIDAEKNIINTASGYTKDQFYFEFQENLHLLSNEYLKTVEDYISSLDSLKKQLENRKDDQLNEKNYIYAKDYSNNIIELRTMFNMLIEKSNNYTKELITKQNEAKKLSRLKEVYDFAHEINYFEQVKTIEELKIKEEEAKADKNCKMDEIQNILIEIDKKQKEHKDERKGAEKVRQLLSDFFGHQFLNLDAIEVKDELTGNKKYIFEIQRNGIKAYHLSEGEKSIIAFCYFMAKLDDVDTKFKKSIIWIDDPISSLDSNHIFYLYSLIKNNIVDKNIFEQLFVTTHNLDFLKYLKRLNGGFINSNSKLQSYVKNYFIINRVDKHSKLAIMPKYLKNYITEFNYLFQQIYACYEIDEITDQNYTTYYNFGNNARKFLEIYLYYKYPDSTEISEKYKVFFGEEGIPAILAERVNNEYSHLAGVMERGASPVEIPEMKKVAELIINKLQDDNEQYTALLRSIGKLEES